MFIIIRDLLRLPRDILRIAHRYPLDSCRLRTGGTCPLVYSLYDLKGLISLRICLYP